MGENQQRILQLLAEGKITVEEATRLLSLVGGESGETTGFVKTARSNAKYLYVKVEPKEGRETQQNPRVNVRVPVSLIRAGMKLTALIPPHVADDINKGMKDKGIGFDIRNLKDEYIEPLVEALHDTEIVVDTPDAGIKLYAE
ncbi:MAG: hypothetical protein JW856_04320 [Dehalococcoidales bacterium]|nr:hypothetical protein [Dehalococcoidales bacterium]